MGSGHRIRKDLLHIDTEDSGFEQYFCSAAGNDPERAIAILERIGAGEQAALMRQAVKLFARGKRWPLLRERRARFEAFTEAERKPFYKLEDEWRYAPIHLLVHMQRYSRASQPAAKELFRRLEKSRPPRSGCVSNYWRSRMRGAGAQRA